MGNVTRGVGLCVACVRAGDFKWSLRLSQKKKHIWCLSLTGMLPTSFVIMTEKLKKEEGNVEDVVAEVEHEGVDIESMSRATGWLTGVCSFFQKPGKSALNKLDKWISEHTRETLYLYLVDEVTGEPVQAGPYPLEIKVAVSA